MNETFNPYRTWLGIDPGLGPPDHYQLLGVSRDQRNPAVIAQAADQALNRVRSIRPGEHAVHWARLLDELRAAKQCLTDPVQRAEYDRAGSQPGYVRGMSGNASIPGVPMSSPDRNMLPTAPPSPMAPTNPMAPASSMAPSTYHPPTSPLGSASLYQDAPPSASHGNVAPYRQGASPSPAYPGPPDPMAPLSAPSASLGASPFPAAGASPYSPSVAPHPAAAPYPAAAAPVAPIDPMAPVSSAPVMPAAGYAAGYAGGGYPPAPANAQPSAPAAPAYPPMQPLSYSADPMAPAPYAPAVPTSPYQNNATDYSPQPSYSAQPYAAQPYGAAMQSAPPYGGASGNGHGAYQAPVYQAPVYQAPVAPTATLVQPWPSQPAEPTPQVRGGNKSATRMAAERARRALQTYLAIGLGATLLLVIGGVLILALGGLGEEGGNQSQQVAADGAVVRPAANTPPRPVRPGTPRPITPTPVTPEPPSPETPVQSDPMPSDPMPSDPVQPIQPAPMPTPPPQSDPPPYRPIPGEPIRDPSFIPGPEPVRRTEPPTPMPEPPQPGTDPVPNPEPPKPETPPMPVAPTAEELAELGRLLTSARQSLSDLNVDAAKTSLAKAEPLARLPEHKQKFDRLQRMADYVGRFREALAESVSKLEPASSIMVGTSTQVGIVETFPNRITVRVAGMNRTYAFEELPVGLAVAIVDLVQLPADESQLIKGAYVMVSKTANDLNREKARTWWEEAGPELGDLMSFVDDSYGFSP